MRGYDRYEYIDEEDPRYAIDEDGRVNCRLASGEYTIVATQVAVPP